MLSYLKFATKSRIPSKCWDNISFNGTAEVYEDALLLGIDEYMDLEMTDNCNVIIDDDGVEYLLFNTTSESYF